VPTDEGLLTVTCPTCRRRFDWNPDAAEEWSKSTLDALFHETQTYRSSAAFKTLLDFIGKFPAHAPYNCFLMHTQNPGVRYVANAGQWRARFNRRIKEGARPLIILIPFGPVDYVYDVDDTEGDPLPREITDPFNATGSVSTAVWQTTITNCARDLVYVVEISMTAGRAGRITTETDAGDIVTLSLKDKGKVVPTGVKARYRLVVNKNYEMPAKYATLVHELAHLYCGHLGTVDEKWWPDRRGLHKDQEEFEAESVCHMVCERTGIKSDSAAYLSNYLRGHTQIPPVSMENIFKAAGLIERMGKGSSRSRDYAKVLDSRNLFDRAP
jgi:hypothetical protein